MPFNVRDKTLGAKGTCSKQGRSCPFHRQTVCGETPRSPSCTRKKESIGEARDEWQSKNRTSRSPIGGDSPPNFLIKIETIKVGGENACQGLISGRRAGKGSTGPQYRGLTTLVKHLDLTCSSQAKGYTERHGGSRGGPFLRDGEVFGEEVQSRKGRLPRDWGVSNWKVVLYTSTIVQTLGEENHCLKKTKWPGRNDRGRWEITCGPSYQKMEGGGVREKNDGRGRWGNPQHRESPGS